MTDAVQPPNENEARYRTLFNSMDEGFCIIQFIDGPHGPLSDYVHVEANAAYATNTGIPDVVGQKVRDMVPGEADGWVELYGEVLRTGRPIRFQRELVATGRYLELAAFRIEPSSRREVAVLFKDVTARRRAELALQQMNETLEARVAAALAEREEAEEALRQAQKMEAVGQLTGGLAHDFNNLLAAISGGLELIRTRIAQGRTQEVEKYLSAAQGATRRAASLTHRLLAFSRRQTLSPQPLLVSRLVGDLEELVRRTVGPLIALEAESDPDLWLTMVDANQLENALLNLCINARDAMPDGGRITIETRNRLLDEQAAREGNLPAGRYVTVKVSDTGAGIEKSILARVFDPFFTTKPLGQGTGLGLSMVYGFARQSHGEVRIESAVGKGTSVCLYLPRHDGEEAKAEAATREPAVKSDKGDVILVVDDEPAIRMLIVEALTDLGYACLEAGDGPAGLAILESGKPIDMLISDVGLPGGLNGRQLADAALTLRPGLKILLITGYAEIAALSRDGIESGMEMMTKPFAIDDLGPRVMRLLES